MTAEEAWDAAAYLVTDLLPEGDDLDTERKRIALELIEQSKVVDLIWASFPCQAFSTAGKREGASDERNGWPWTVDAIDRFKPRWVLAENVRGLLCHSADGHPDPFRCPRCYFDSVILAQLRARYDYVGWFLIDCADLGLPQHRRRVIIWAGPAPLQPPRLTHGDPKKARQADLFGPGVLPWVSMREALGLDDVQVIGAGRNPQAAGEPRTYRDITDEPSTCVAAHEIWNAGPWIVDAKRLNDRPAPTVSAVGECKGSGPGANPWKMQRASDQLFMMTGRRRLTLAECSLLQGFPDHWPFAGGKRARYRQIGNAVPPVLAQAVVEQVMNADRQIGED